ncbi:unnamed protein product [Sympodiomycopsis kandeliae]
MLFDRWAPMRLRITGVRRHYLVDGEDEEQYPADPTAAAQMSKRAIRAGDGREALDSDDEDYEMPAPSRPTFREEEFCEEPNAAHPQDDLAVVEQEDLNNAIPETQAKLVQMITAGEEIPPYRPGTMEKHQPAYRPAIEQKMATLAATMGNITITVNEQVLANATFKPVATTAVSVNSEPLDTMDDEAGDPDESNAADGSANQGILFPKF